MLFIITDQATRQIIGEVEPSSLEDSNGFVFIKDPLLFGEIVNSGKVTQIMRPVFQTVTVNEIKVKVSEYMEIGDDNSATREAYTRSVQAYRFQQSGLVIPTSDQILNPIIPGNGTKGY